MTQEELLQLYQPREQNNNIFEKAFFDSKAALDVISFSTLAPEVQSEFTLERSECYFKQSGPRGGGGFHYQRRFSDDPDWEDV